VTPTRAAPRWYAAGDGNAFFGLALTTLPVTALVWASSVVWIVEGRLGRAAAALAIASLATLVGVIHSPLPSGSVFWPWAAPGALPFAVAAAYGVAAALLVLLDRWGARGASRA